MHGQFVVVRLPQVNDIPNVNGRILAILAFGQRRIEFNAMQYNAHKHAHTLTQRIWLVGSFDANPLKQIRVDFLTRSVGQEEVSAGFFALRGRAVFDEFYL
jgi:hypothetical protein